jgi:signal transduction histidine kinase
MNLRRLYAVDGVAMLVIGVGLAGWGPMAISWFGSKWAGGVTNDGFWRAAVFIRLFGAALMAFGMAALAMWRAREPQAQRGACPYFFLAHSVLTGAVWGQQTAVWDTAAGVALVNVFVLFQAAFGYFWVGRMRQPGFPYRQSIPQLRSEWERRIREAAGQQERNRLARDLHDSIKQQIYAIQALLAAAQAQSGTTEDPIELARGAARNAMAEMNVLLDQLKASPLETVGLVEALRRQCEALGLRTGTDVRAVFGTLPPDNRLPPGVQTEIFRIAQEALSNIGRHARATSASLQMGAAPPNHLVLTVRDDGGGFAGADGGSGMGLRNMRSRAEAIGGSLQIESAPGTGCAVTLRVPLEAPEVEEYCRHMRLAGLAFGFAFALLGLSVGLRESGYALPGALGAGAAIYHLTQYARWKRIAKGMGA